MSLWGFVVKYKFYIEFNDSDIPADITITSAVINLYPNSFAAGALDVHVFDVFTPLGESEGTVCDTNGAGLTANNQICGKTT